MTLFAGYHPRQQARLRATYRSRAWQEVLRDSDYLSRARAENKTPPGSPSQSDGTARYLKEHNGPAARALAESEPVPREVVEAVLGDWRGPLADDPEFPLHFLGLVLTLDCSFTPRCLYCNQVRLETGMTPADWRRVIAESARPVPPYIYLTGGEPLLLGEEVWGDDGLVAFGVSHGCAVNINTNAALITPRAAIQLAKVGLARLHISVDSAERNTQARLFGRTGRVDAVWRGIHNVLIAREILGTNHPQIHINCVVTRLNMFQFPQLLKRILEAAPLPVGPDPLAHPAYRDFGFHLIPVGGPSNAPIRPTAEEWKRFYTETWDEAEAVWQGHLASLGVPPDRRESLASHVPYANPYLRVRHGVSLEEYCERAAQGSYWQGALTSRCYVAPGQAFVLPDGSQQWCGAHAIRRPEPIGNVRSSSLRANIHAAADRIPELPVGPCASCAGATCAMNQSIEHSLREDADAIVSTQG